jgi:PUA domain protein
VVPTLQFLQSDLVLKKITVDMGAIKFVVNGADIMRPGIVAIEDGIAKDDFIVVIDEQNGKALAVGIALLGTEEIRSSTSGKVIRNIHYVGDDIWKQ